MEAGSGFHLGARVWRQSIPASKIERLDRRVRVLAPDLVLVDPLAVDRQGGNTERASAYDTYHAATRQVRPGLANRLLSRRRQSEPRTGETARVTQDALK